MPGMDPACAAVSPIPIPPAPLRYVPSDKPFRTVRQWLRGLGPIESLLDVGCGSSLAVTWGAARKRYSIDPLDRPPLQDVSAFQGLFPDDWPAAIEHVSAALCLDVLQDAHRPAVLAAAVLAIADRVYVSIPLGRGADLPVIPDPLHRLETWFGQRAKAYEFERTDPARLIALFVRFTPTIGCRVQDKDGNAYTFEAWVHRGPRRYARVLDAGGRRHQLAERQLRAA